MAREFGFTPAAVQKMTFAQVLAMFPDEMQEEEAIGAARNIKEDRNRWVENHLEVL